MSTAGSPLPKELNSEETTALLQRILVVVEKDKRNRWVDITSAVVLSLATMSSAWCAYQSTLWGGVQTFRLAAANKTGREISTANLAALQNRAFDASMGVSWMQARHDGNDRQEKFLFDRFRPEMKKAVEAWLKTDPFNNPAAPLGPLKMAEYVQPELIDVKRFEEFYAQEYDGAIQANQTSDTYLLHTVLFASVLFFGGIAGTLDSRRLRASILVLALALFALTTAFLASMPICME
ncbi:MAG: hypothetical protein ACK506_14960 [Pirellula sp.]|jgi:hypothetical protein